MDDPLLLNITTTTIVLFIEHFPNVVCNAALVTNVVYHVKPLDGFALYIYILYTLAFGVSCYALLKTKMSVYLEMKYKPCNVNYSNL